MQRRGALALLRLLGRRLWAELPAGLFALLLALAPWPTQRDIPIPPNAVYYIVVHHAASGWDADPHKPQASLDISAADIDKEHRERGFDCIGYHYVVRFDGAIEKGRGEDLRGAHARAYDGRGISYNASSIAVCFSGNCDFAPWTEPQHTSGVALILELMRRYGVPPERVIGHRECGMHTDCPGTLIDMNALRSELRLRVAQAAAAAPRQYP